MDGLKWWSNNKRHLPFCTRWLSIFLQLRRHQLQWKKNFLHQSRQLFHFETDLTQKLSVQSGAWNPGCSLDFYRLSRICILSDWIKFTSKLELRTWSCAYLIFVYNLCLKFSKFNHFRDCFCFLRFFHRDWVCQNWDSPSPELEIRTSSPIPSLKTRPSLRKTDSESVIETRKVYESANVIYSVRNFFIIPQQLFKSHRKDHNNSD